VFSLNINYKQSSRQSIQEGLSERGAEKELKLAKEAKAPAPEAKKIETPSKKEDSK
jgi:hypothetical protein